MGLTEGCGASRVCCLWAAVGWPSHFWGTSVCLFILCRSLSWCSTYTHIHFCGAKSWSLLLVPVVRWPTISLEDKPTFLAPQQGLPALCYLCRPAFHWGVTCFCTPLLSSPKERFSVSVSLSLPVKRSSSMKCPSPQFLSSVQSLSRVRLFATPWPAAHQASLSITNCRSLLKLISIE